jgi:hypothetical protein
MPYSTLISRSIREPAAAVGQQEERSTAAMGPDFLDMPWLDFLSTD